MPDLTVTIDIDETLGTMALRCRGDIDAHTCGKLEAALTAPNAARARLLIVDLSDVTYVASRTIGILMAAQARLEQSGTSMVIVSPGDFVKTAIDVLGLEGIFTLAEHEEDISSTAEG
jgi:anti-anti-sigma factor